MRCEHARRELSEAFDGGPAVAVAVDDHVAGCAGCTDYARRIGEVRQRLRFETVEGVPDVAPRVSERLRRGAVALPAPKRRAPAPLVHVAAVAFVAAFVVGAVVIGVGERQPRQVFADDISRLVVDAQARLSALSASVDVVERGWHPDVPERTYSGELRYRAPESLSLRVEDATRYPSSAWAPNNVRLVVDEDRSWSSGRPPCPVDSQPRCYDLPRRLAVERREPFPDVSPAPLDLVLPVRSFGLAGPREVLGRTETDGREALVVATAVSQVEPLLTGLLQAGNWRELHPTDQVELELDAETMVALAVTVTPAETPERDTWAAERGYDDEAGVPILELRFTDVELNGAVPVGSFPDAPEATLERDAGFVDGAPTSAGPRPAWVPAGMSPYRSGALRAGDGPPVEIRSWTDGRAWLKVRSTDDWPGGRLFGDVGSFVRPVDLGRSGTAYVGNGGSRIAIHGDGIDVAVSGSVTPGDLLQVASSLGVQGRPVPAGWSESGTETLAEVRREVTGLLVPDELDGFGVPAVRVDGDTVTVAYPGPGDRSFVLVQSPGRVLSPPLGGDVRGVEVRGTTGRWSAKLGELEWVEDGRAISLRSASLSLAELAEVADQLRPA